MMKCKYFLISHKNITILAKLNKTAKTNQNMLYYGKVKQVIISFLGILSTFKYFKYF